MNEHLTTLREMRDEIDEYLQTPGPDDEEFRKERDALDAAILALELLEAAAQIVIVDSDLPDRGTKSHDLFNVGTGWILSTNRDNDIEYPTATAAYSALKEKTNE